MPRQAIHLQHISIPHKVVYCSTFKEGIYMKNTILVTTPRGLSPYLRTEIESLGYPIHWAGPSGVETEGDFTDAMEMNLFLRTAHHVLYRVGKFRCNNPDELYKHINHIPWETMIPSNEYLSVVSNVLHPSIRDTRYANLKSKDAIVDRILSRKGKRPDSGPEKTGAVVSIFWKDETCSVYIDTSGEPLSKRGYRKIPLHAPMQETLAAGVIKASDWQGNGNFINPMCGSGTIAIEAALIGLKMAPGILRKNYGFFHTLLFNNESWKVLKQKASFAQEKQIKGKIIATDNSSEAIEAARKNARAAGVESHIEFKVCDFSETPIPPEGGVVVINPEYGIRLGDEKKLEETYRNIGNFLKRRCQGYKGYVFTGNTMLAGKTGLKSKRKIPFTSGKIDCRLYEYELYAGSKENRNSIT